MVPPFRDPNPALKAALSSNGSYDTRKIAEWIGVRPRKLAELLGHHPTALNSAGSDEGLQADLAALVAVLALIGSTGASPEAIRTWLRQPIPGLGYRVPLQMVREGQIEELLDRLEGVVEGMPR